MINSSEINNASIPSPDSSAKDDISTTNIIYGVYTTLVSVFTITGNLLIILAFIWEHSLREKASNLFILALSSADLMYGVYMCVFSTPLAILRVFPYGEIGCMLAVGLSNITYIYGNFLLVAISIDRVLLVSMDYSRYSTFQTKPRVKLTIFICFVSCVAITVFELCLWNYAKRVNIIARSLTFSHYCLSPPRRIKTFGLSYSLGFICGPVFLVAILSSAFFCLLYKRIKKNSKIGNDSSSSANSQPSANNSTDSNNDGSSSHGVKRYMKAAVTLSALVTSMGVSMLPYCIYVLVELFCPLCSDPKLVYILLTIIQCNPLLDPIFYGATQPKIRQLYKNKFRKFFI